MPGGTLILFYSGGGGPTVPVPTPDYDLTFVQSRFLSGLADLWEPVRTAASDGDVSAPTYTRRFTNVPCYMQYLAGDSEPQDIGRTEQVNMFTKSQWWFSQHQELDDGWIAILRTVPNDGTIHEDLGVGWVFGGDARRWVNQVGGEGMTLIVGVQQPKLPDGVS